MNDDELLTIWRSVTGPKAGLTGPLIVFAARVSERATSELKAAYDNEQHVMRQLQVRIDEQSDHIRRLRNDCAMWEARAEHAAQRDSEVPDTWARICPECVGNDHGSCSGEPCGCPCATPREIPL